jgi:hypothetical protein
MAINPHLYDRQSVLCDFATLMPPKQENPQQQPAVAKREPHYILNRNRNRRLQQRRQMSAGNGIWVVLIAATIMLSLDSGYSRKRPLLLSMILCHVEAFGDNDGPLQPRHRPIVIEHTNLVYEPPFTEDRYFADVASVLQAHRSVLEEGRHFGNEENEGLQKWDEADWLVLLGHAHRYVLTELLTKRAVAGMQDQTLEAMSQFDGDIE